MIPDDFTASSVSLSPEETIARLEHRLAEAQDQIHRQGLQLEAVFNAMTDSVIFLDRNRHTERANPPAVKDLGYNPVGQEPGALVESLSGQPDGSRLLAITQHMGDRALSGELLQNDPYTFIDAAGKERSILVSAFPLWEAGEIRGAIVIWRDITERKQAAGALAESEFRFRHLADAMPQLVWSARPDGKVDYYNIRHREYWGISPADGGEWDWAPVVHPEDLQATLEAWERALRTGVVYNVEHRVLSSGGAYRWHLSRGVPARDAHGQILRWFGTATDIHDLKMAEQELQLLAKLPVENPEPVLRLSSEGQVLFANPVATKLLIEWGSQAGGQAPERLQDLVKQCLETGTPEIAELKFGRKVYRLTAAPIHENGYVNLYGADITKRNLVETRLALLSDAAGELLHGEDPVALLENLCRRLEDLAGVDAYFYFKLAKDGSHLHLEAKSGVKEGEQGVFERFSLGQGICGMVALTRHEMVAEDIQHDTRTITQPLRDMGITAYACFPLVYKQELAGTLSFGSRQRTHFDDETVSLLRAVNLLFASALERKRVELALQDYAGQLERSNRELQEFAYVASHDLQEPLRKIDAFSNFLLASTENLNPQQSDYITRMQSAAGRMRKMVESLLDLSRVSTQGQPFQPVDLNEVAKEVLTDLEVILADTAGHVELKDLPVVEGDPLQMQQLLLNLLGNALKYHPIGVPPVVKISASQVSPTRVEIRVEDNGIGFDEQHLERIFLPFQRLVGRNEFEGSGMGLAICRKIVERHGGEITARSTPGQGSVFLVTLPVKPSASR